MNEDKPSPSPEQESRGKLGWLFKVLPPVLLAGGLVGAVMLVKTRPRPERKPPPSMQALVRVMEPEAGQHTVTVRAMGTVVPAREVQLEARVSGAVVWVHPEFKEGGIFQAEETLLRIDPRDYELALARAEAQVARADFEYQLELGHQDVAKREYALIQGDRPATEREQSLALRKPHLRSAEASLASAQADLAQARLHLERTEIKAPFNALLRSRHTELGAIIGPQKPLASLVGTDAYWVRVSLPVDRLTSLQMAPGLSPPELKARVSLGPSGPSWNGRVIRLLGDLEENGRMARLLVEITKPFEPLQSQPMLLLGSYVHVEVDGKVLDQAVLLPRSVLRENNALWLIDENQTLEIRPVTVAWKDVDFVYLTEGLEPGDRVVVSNLAIPVPGMPLVVEGEKAPDATSEPEAEPEAP